MTDRQHNIQRPEYPFNKTLSGIQSASPKAINLLPEIPKTELTYTREDDNTRSFVFFFFLNASLCDWVRRWVLTEKSPRRLCYLSKAQFRLFLIKAACSRYKGRTCHSAHVCHPRVSWKAERQLICRTTDNHSLAPLLHTLARTHAYKSNRDTLASLHLVKFSCLADPSVCGLHMQA